MMSLISIKKKSDKQHILDNPDTYIGSVELVESNEFIYDSFLWIVLDCFGIAEAGRAINPNNKK